jgi:nicotinamidase-related amidase
LRRYGVNRRVALLVIDLQTAVFEDPAVPPVFDAVTLLENARTLVDAARSGGIPVVYVQHCGRAGDEFEEGRPGWYIYEPIAPRPGEPVVRKHKPDAFEGTQLQEVLESLSVRSLVITGAQSEHCVAATCRRAAQLSYEVLLASDGHSTWASETQTAAEIIAEQNATLGAGLVNLRTSSRLVAELRGA